MVPERIDPNMTVDEIMRRSPNTIRVMLRHHMLCIGCPIAVFHTVHDACKAHEIDEEAFAGELLLAMHSDALASTPSAFCGEEDSTTAAKRLAAGG